MKHVSKSELKAKMLEYFREIEKNHEELIVTDHGKPTLKITPITSKKKPQEIFSKHLGKVLYLEPITAPTTDEWRDI